LGPFWQANLGHGLPLLLMDRGSDAKTLAKEASGPWKEEWDMKARLWIGLQMPGADMTQPNSWKGIFTDILCNE